MMGRGEGCSLFLYYWSWQGGVACCPFHALLQRVCRAAACQAVLFLVLWRGARRMSEQAARMDLPAERETLINQREREAAVSLPALTALKERTCEAVVLVLTALVRQAQRLLAGQAEQEQTALSKRGQLAGLALQDLGGLYEQTLRLIYRLFVTEAVARAGLLALAEEPSLGGGESRSQKLLRMKRTVLTVSGEICSDGGH
jgi:hypothetical protein